jgi:hypothetical protein
MRVVDMYVIVRVVVHAAGACGSSGRVGDVQFVLAASQL